MNKEDLKNNFLTIVSSIEKHYGDHIKIMTGEDPSAAIDPTKYEYWKGYVTAGRALGTFVNNCLTNILNAIPDVKKLDAPIKVEDGQTLTDAVEKATDSQ